MDRMRRGTVGGLLVPNKATINALVEAVLPVCLIEHLDLIVPKRLTSPNETRGHHWVTRHRDTKAWERELMVLRPSRWNLITKTESRRDRRGQYRIVEDRREERRRVTIVRCLPSRRNFCKDSDNLAFSAKPLKDAMTRLGLIFDDSMKWLDSTVRDAVSPDGGDYTVIRLEIIQQ